MSPSYLFILFIALCAFTNVLGDLYMQNPRGNNDRLNEDGDRDNANRLFDSQNNAQGGYCYGPELTYLEASQLSIQWTNQHSCGNGNTDCQMIFQYMCTSDSAGAPTTDIIRDGTTTTSITTSSIVTNTAAYYNYKDPATGGTKYYYGMNENILYYETNIARKRNTNLFTADQQLTANKGALATRQNPTGQLYGFECQEERDYYPYWHPSPWKDIAVMVNDITTCPMYQAQSQNVLAKNYCNVGAPSAQAGGTTPNNEADCATAKGNWTEAPAFGIAAPDCLSAPLSRDNHLGNGVDGQPNTYNWTLPTADVEPCITNGNCTCVLRMRYNITLGEVTSDLTNADNGKGVSPVATNPNVQTADGTTFTLALDTSQSGRTFQDRSFMFRISSRAAAGVAADAVVYNLNVRGKRGNIVQTYPATEYDFVPTNLEVNQGDTVNIQWTGCDTNPAANAGQGTDSTDRSNIVQFANSGANYPVNSSFANPLFTNTATRMRMASIDQAGCATAGALAKAAGDITQNPANCFLLNAAGPHFSGALVTLDTVGDYYYGSTRNNNFSNRSQKGTIKVKGKTVLAGWQTAVIVVAVVVAVAVGALVGTVVYAKRNPHSRAADVVGKIPGLNKI